MLLKFTKMQGLGNDFVVLDLLGQKTRLEKRLLRLLGDRHRGIGCDQVLVVEAPQHPDFDFRFRIFNADGREVEQCGNGVRCVAKFVRDKRLTGKQEIRFETLGGPLSVRCIKGNLYSVNMGQPRLEPENIPFEADQPANTYTIDVGQETLEVSAVSMGNPHAVSLVSDVTLAAVAEQGAALQQHARFPRSVNVGFMELINRREIRLRVFERDVGETRACGSGACAAVVAGNLRGLLDHRVKVNLPSGFLTVEWRGGDRDVFMTGPAATVFEGQIIV